MRRSKLGVLTALWLTCVLMAGAHAKGGTLIIRLEMDHGQVQFFHNGKRLKDATLERLCATAHQQKNDIQFVRAKMTRDDALTAILGEAQCLGAPKGKPR